MVQSMEESEVDLCKFVGGLKVGASVMGLAMNEQANVVAIALSRLEGDVWDGCLEVWDLASLSPDQANPATSAAAGCLGRFPLPCGAGPVAWVSARPDDQSNANAGATANPYAKPLLCVGCDDGNIQVLAWDAKKKSLTKFASLNEHDGAITCFATATSSNALPSLASLAQAAAAAANSSKQQEAGSQSSSSTSSKKNSTSNSGSLLASGATDGTVRIWDLGASIPQASSHVLSSPYGGASVSTLAVAPSYWGSIGAVSDASSASGSASMANNKALSIVVVGYGGASAQATPSMSVWHRGQFVTSSPSLQHLSSSSSSQQWPMSPAEVTGPIPFAFPLHATPTPSADAIDKRNYQVRSTPPPPPLPSTEQPQPPTVVVSSTATPLCGTFLGPTCPNVVAIGFDDGLMATYDISALQKGPLSASYPHGCHAVRSLAARPSANDDKGCDQPLLCSCSERGDAVLTTMAPKTGEDLQKKKKKKEEDVVLCDQRDDYILACVWANASHVLTGGMDGQVRLISVGL